jgi:hypothetical protein
MKTVMTVVSIAVWSAVAFAQAPVHTFEVPRHGSLKLSVPAAWSESVQRAEGGMPPTIEFTEEKTGTKLLVTPLWSPDEDPQFTSEPYIKAAVERSAASVQPSSDEKLVLRDIKTVTGAGHYFHATDRAPAEGEFKYMASGVVPAGRLLLSFTVLCHDGKPAAMDGALEIVRSAAHQ